jgi:hypothetical protein
MIAVRSFLTFLSTAALLLGPASAGPIEKVHHLAVVNKTSCGGRNFIYRGLAGYGTLPSDFRDKHGDTISPGSSIAISEWTAVNSSTYKATLYGLPDRGW